MNKKTILFFMDLEGTLLSEETGKIREEDFKRLLDEILVTDQIYYFAYMQEMEEMIS